MGWDRRPGDLLAEIYEDDFGAMIRDIGLTASRSLILKTPVDTGRLRGGWFASIGETRQVPRTGLDKTGAEALGQVSLVVRGVRPGDVVVLENNVEYGIYVNDGSPTIRPHRMLERTVDELVGFFN